MMTRHAAFAPLLALLLAGCSLAPQYERPTISMPEQFVPAGAGDDAGSAGPAAVDTEWRAYFRDATLLQLIDAALAGNRDLRVAALRIEEARALYGIQRAERWPTLEARLEYRRTAEAGVGESSASNLYLAGVGVSAFELDLFGRVRNLSAAALARYLATEEAARAVRISLIAEVANAYVLERSLAELEQVAARTLDARQSSLNTIRRRFDAGVEAAIEVQTAQMLTETARATHASIVRERSQAMSRLRWLIGDVGADLQPFAGSMAQIEFAAPAPGLPSALLERRPDVREAEQRLKAANADIGAARAAFFPRIALTGEAGSASEHLSDLFQAGTGAWTFMPQITLPIFAGGRNRAGLELARVRKEISIVEYEQAIQTAFREVADALVANAQIATQLSAQRGVEQADRERLRLAQRRYERGVASYLELLDAQRSHFDSSQELIRLRALQLGSSIDLYKALGGGAAGDAPGASP